MSKTLTRTTRFALTALAVACSTLAPIAEAQAQGHYHGGGHYYHGGRGGWGWGGVGLGIGLGVGLGLGSYYGWPGYYYDPGYVVVERPATVVYTSPQPVPAGSPAQQPVIYPRNGQTAAQMDADSNACSEWAGRQPNATADGRIFQRGIAACMDARGYTLR